MSLQQPAVFEYPQDVVYVKSIKGISLLLYMYSLHCVTLKAAYRHLRLQLFHIVVVVYAELFPTQSSQIRRTFTLTCEDINEILENVAIANALQLEAARRRAVPIRFNFVARAKFEVAQPIRCRLRAFLLLIRYVTL